MSFGKHTFPWMDKVYMMLTVVKLFQQEEKIRVNEIVLQILRGKYQIMIVAIRLKTLVCISSIIGHQYFMYLYFFLQSFLSNFVLYHDCDLEIIFCSVT